VCGIAPAHLGILAHRLEVGCRVADVKALALYDAAKQALILRVRRISADICACCKSKKIKHESGKRSINTHTHTHTDLAELVDGGRELKDAIDAQIACNVMAQNVEDLSAQL
jgi:hypothetical protein